MPLPIVEPALLPAVKAWASITDDADDTVLTTVVLPAVNGLVRGLPIAQASNTDPAPAAWPGQVTAGAVMLAARLHRRMNTPGGVESAGAFGVAYVRRNDPDVAQLLELGEYAPPAVG